MIATENKFYQKLIKVHRLLQKNIFGIFLFLKNCIQFDQNETKKTVRKKQLFFLIQNEIFSHKTNRIHSVNLNFMRKYNSVSADSKKQKAKDFIPMSFFKKSILNLIGITMCFSFMTGCMKNVFDIEGNGQSTADVGFNPGLDPAPIGLRIISTSVSNQVVTLTWSKADFATSYDLYYRELGTINFSKIENVTSPKNVTGLVNNRIYEFKITAVNLRGVTESELVQATPVNGSSTTGEFVSASAQLAPTPGNRHIVQGSLGGPTDKVYGTSQRGYKIFFNSQGQVLDGL